MTAIALATEPLQIPAAVRKGVLARIDHGLYICEAELRHTLRWRDQTNGPLLELLNSNTVDSSKARSTSALPTTAAITSPRTMRRTGDMAPRSTGRCAHEPRPCLDPLTDPPRPPRPTPAVTPWPK
jgi:hypothetical protein